MQAALEPALFALKEAGVSPYADAATRAAAERDFGNVAQGRCLLVAEPNDPEACARLVAALRRRGVGCTVRGAGYSQGGQSLPSDTVLLSTRRLDTIRPFDAAPPGAPTARSVSVGAGATLRNVLQALGEPQLVPPALPLNLDMTLGGLLSAGGIGPTSHKHGPVAANVMRLDVVTGTGELRACTPTSDSDLFYGVLAGMGQCGVITQATLALHPAPRAMRSFSFHYVDPEAWLHDQLGASSADAGFEIEAFCWAAARGSRSTPRGRQPFTHWMYGLHLAIDRDLADEAPARNLLASLRADRKLDEHESPFTSYLHRYEARFAGMVESGAWHEPHPWFEGMVPVERAGETLARILERLPGEVGDGHRVMLVDARRMPGLFDPARSGKLALVGIFPVAFARSALPKVLRSVDDLTSIVLEAKGRRYLSGWIGTDAAAYFRAHFGDGPEGQGARDTWLATRRRFDPDGVFRSALFPHGHAT
jgi:cytokinin dehydrogenase